MNPSYTYGDGDTVSYNVQAISGHGIVRGVSSAPVPVLGAHYIIEDTSGVLPTEAYPFKFIAIAEVFLKPFQKS